jgi:cyclin B
VASLFVASKFEEIYPPNIKDFVYVCDRAYTKDEILQMEGSILNTINFQLNYVSPTRFLELQIIENTLIEDSTIFQN